MDLERIDNVTLTKMIHLCFDLSTNGGVPDEFQPIFFAMGKRLRGTLVNLLSVQFDSQAPKFISASAELKEVNKALKKTSDNLTKFADTVEQIGKLLGVLDDLLSIAVSFV
jgi:hypothetical protein